MSEHGLDMASTIAWYTANYQWLKRQCVPKPSPRRLGYPTEQSNHLPLTPHELQALCELFPNAALKRSVLHSIVGKPPTWFHRVSAIGSPQPTTNMAEALTKTAIIPAYTSNQRWIDTKIPASDIHLYQIDETLASAHVRKIIAQQAFVHELMHTIINPALYLDDHCLILSDNTIVQGKRFIDQFAELAEWRKPISHYASSYRGQDGRFKNNDPGERQTAINEELAETGTAYLLGFSFVGEGQDERNWQPFADRNPIRDFIEEFLNAKKI